MQFTEQIKKQLDRIRQFKLREDRAILLSCIGIALVFWILVIATAGEYILGISGDTQTFLLMMVIALIKAGFIVSKYMNIGRLFSGEEESH